MHWHSISIFPTLSWNSVILFIICFLYRIVFKHYAVDFSATYSASVKRNNSFAIIW